MSTPIMHTCEHSLILDIEKTLGINILNSRLDKISLAECEQADIELFVKRDDLIHPIISGNKWRKLKYIISHAIANNFDHLISMGGSHSNHLHALAYIGKQLGLKTTTYIRGHENTNTSTLEEIQNWGMNLIFVDRNTFRELRSYKTYDSKPAKKHAGYWIPEGGANPLALKGVSEILNEIDINYGVLSLACGTGTSLAGLVHKTKHTVIGFSSFKDKDFLVDEIANQFELEKNDSWSINNNYHFGGFGKYNDELIEFMNDFYARTTIELEQVYTAKLFFGLIDLIKQSYFARSTKIIALHTGGLQGKLKSN